MVRLYDRARIVSCKKNVPCVLRGFFVRAKNALSRGVTNREGVRDIIVVR